MADTVSGITEKAVALLGGQAALGRALNGTKQQVVGYWVKNKGQFPAEQILHIERLLKEKGSSIDRYDLRPDVYGERPADVNDLSDSAA